MKRILFYTLLLITAGFSSCQKDDDPAFDKSPDERINETLKKYQAALSGATYGWKASVQTGSGAVFNFHFKFNDSNRVFMYSDFDTTTTIVLKESSFRLKALQQPSLLFDTYSYIHMLADPDAGVNGGDYGIGLYSDFEFAIDEVKGDSIKLTGRQHNTKVTLVKSTQQELADWESGKWKTTLGFLNTAKYLSYFIRFTAGAEKFDVQMDHGYRQIMFIWYDANGQNRQTIITPFSYKPNGLVLSKPVTRGSFTVSELNDLSFDATTNTVFFTVNGVPATIKEEIKPIVTDLNGPFRWWQTAASEGTYWATIYGFHVNGVNDAFGLTRVPNYYGFTVFFPQYNISSGVVFDLMGVVTTTTGTPAISYGPAFRPPVFSTDGRVNFPLFGTLGSVPAAATNAIVNTRNQMVEANGYYLVQIDENNYDMVSAKDARAWIRWQW